MDIDQIEGRLRDLGPADRLSVADTQYLAGGTEQLADTLRAWARYAATLSATDPDDADRGFRAHDGRMLVAVVRAELERRGQLEDLAQLDEAQQGELLADVERRRVEAAERERAEAVRAEAEAARDRLAAERAEIDARLRQAEVEAAAAAEAAQAVGADR